MIYAKDNTGKLRTFSIGTLEEDLEQVGTFDKAKALKMTALQEANINLEGAVLSVIIGGKV